MKNKFKLLVLICLAAAAVLLCACNGRAEDYYEAHQIEKVNITQKASDTFLYRVKSDIAPSSSAKVYVTLYDSIPAGAAALDYTAENGEFVFTSVVTYAQYYIWITDGAKTAVLPLTRPQMAPSLRSTVSGSSSVGIITYNFVNGTSWSSFCDPTGKAVYKSSEPVYNANAVPVAVNVAISGVDSTTDAALSDDAPYYFVVLTAKNGAVTYVSAPIVTYEKAFTDVSVNLLEESGKPMLIVTGKFLIGGDVAAELYSADTKLGKVTEVVGERISGAAGSVFTAKVDASKVVIGEKGEGVWFDIKLAASSGALYELPSSVVDMTMQLKNDGATFEFKEWNDILKLTYSYYDFEITGIRIENIEEVPTLIVDGTLSDKVNKIKLHADAEVEGKKRDFYWENTATGKAFHIEAPLNSLPITGTPWCWFHLYIYTGTATVATSTADLNRGSEIAVGAVFTYEGIKYTVREYSGGGSQLVIQPELLTA